MLKYHSSRQGLSKQRTNKADVKTRYLIPLPIVLSIVGLLLGIHFMPDGLLELSGQFFDGKLKGGGPCTGGLAAILEIPWFLISMLLNVGIVILLVVKVLGHFLLYQIPALASVLLVGGLGAFRLGSKLKSVSKQSKS